MKERPILFSGEMVRAILDGRKTQTRRLVTPQPQPSQRFVGLQTHLNYPASEGQTWAGFDHKADGDLDPVFVRCPYGAPGDRLWVREAWAAFSTPSHEYGECEEREGPPSEMPDLYGTTCADVVYAADGTSNPSRWRPSIHMPRWASRLTLEVVAVRVERLQDITDADALAEGIRSTRLEIAEMDVYHVEGWPTDRCGETARDMFRFLWDSINGKRATWQSNPWVWVVTFKSL